MPTLQPSEDLFSEVLKTHPFTVIFSGLGKAGNDVNSIPGAYDWLNKNVRYEDWEVRNP